MIINDPHYPVLYARLSICLSRYQDPRGLISFPVIIQFQYLQSLGYVQNPLCRSKRYLSAEWIVVSRMEFFISLQGFQDVVGWGIRMGKRRGYMYCGFAGLHLGWYRCYGKIEGGFYLFGILTIYLHLQLTLVGQKAQENSAS